MTSWREAAIQYQKNRPEQIRADEEQEIETAAKGLDDFLADGEGGDAKMLLAASGQFIRLGEDDLGSGHVGVFILTAEGLRFSSETGGLSAAYSSEKGGSPPRPILTSEFVRRVAHCETGRKKPSEILPFIRTELDRIAGAAPKDE